MLHRTLPLKAKRSCQEETWILVYKSWLAVSLLMAPIKSSKYVWVNFEADFPIESQSQNAELGRF